MNSKLVKLLAVIGIAAGLSACNSGVDVDLSAARQAAQAQRNLPILTTASGKEFSLAFLKDYAYGGGAFANKNLDGTRYVMLISDDGANRNSSMIQLNCKEGAYKFGFSSEKGEWKKPENKVSGVNYAIQWGCAVPVKE
jgi:hypothetical protein